MFDKDIKNKWWDLTIIFIIFLSFIGGYLVKTTAFKTTVNELSECNAQLNIKTKDLEKERFKYLNKMNKVKE
jgi:hypothetical protein